MSGNGIGQGDSNFVNSYKTELRNIGVPDNELENVKQENVISIFKFFDGKDGKEDGKISDEYLSDLSFGGRINEKNLKNILKMYEEEYDNLNRPAQLGSNDPAQGTWTKAADNADYLYNEHNWTRQPEENQTGGANALKNDDKLKGINLQEVYAKDKDWKALDDRFKNIEHEMLEAIDKGADQTTISKYRNELGLLNTDKFNIEARLRTRLGIGPNQVTADDDEGVKRAKEAVIERLKQAGVTAADDDKTIAEKLSKLGGDEPAAPASSSDEPAPQPEPAAASDKPVYTYSDTNKDGKINEKDLGDNKVIKEFAKKNGLLGKKWEEKGEALNLLLKHVNPDKNVTKSLDDIKRQIIENTDMANYAEVTAALQAVTPEELFKDNLVSSEKTKNGHFISLKDGTKIAINAEDTDRKGVSVTKPDGTVEKYDKNGIKKNDEPVRSADRAQVRGDTPIQRDDSAPQSDPAAASDKPVYTYGDTNKDGKINEKDLGDNKVIKDLAKKQGLLGKKWEEKGEALNLLLKHVNPDKNVTKSLDDIKRQIIENTDMNNHAEVVAALQVVKPEELFKDNILASGTTNMPGSPFTIHLKDNTTIVIHKDRVDVGSEHYNKDGTKINEEPAQSGNGQPAGRDVPAQRTDDTPPAQPQRDGATPPSQGDGATPPPTERGTDLVERTSNGDEPTVLAEGEERQVVQPAPNGNLSFIDPDQAAYHDGRIQAVNDFLGLGNNADAAKFRSMQTKIANAAEKFKNGEKLDKYECNELGQAFWMLVYYNDPGLEPLATFKLKGEYLRDKQKQDIRPIIEDLKKNEPADKNSKEHIIWENKKNILESMKKCNSQVFKEWAPHVNWLKMILQGTLGIVDAAATNMDNKGLGATPNYMNLQTGRAVLGAIHDYQPCTN